MKVLKTLLCIFLVIFIPFSAGRYADGYYFDFERIIDHYLTDFPAFPDFSGGNFLEITGALFFWVFDFFRWIVAPDPWTLGHPSYRGGTVL